MRLVIISGRSGSGKTVALHALEDRGFYCIDNLPISFLASLEHHIGDRHPLVAVSIDARNIPNDFTTFKKVIETLNKAGNSCEIIYLDAHENDLLRRFSETRRKHPLTDQKTTLREAIRKEHDLLTPIASLADLTINTSPLTHQALFNLINDRIFHHKTGQIQIVLQSFGFKHGAPPDTDFMFDVRCLPNPYWQTSLRALSGLDNEVIQYLEAIPAVKKLLTEISLFLENWIPQFEADNRSYLTVSIGCTGGQHRSVYLVESLAKRLQKKFLNIQVRHRELNFHYDPATVI